MSDRKVKAYLELVPGRDKKVELLVVGDVPGSAEFKAERPFSDYAGNFLRETLTDIVSSIPSFTYLFRSRPPNDDISAFFRSRRDRDGELLGGKYIAASARADVRALHNLILRHRPEKILTLGVIPLWALTGQCNPKDRNKVPSGISQFRGSTYLFEGIPVISTYDPAEVCKTYQTNWIFRNDLRRLNRKKDLFENTSYSILQNPRTIVGNIYHDLLGNNPVRNIAVDIETSQSQISCIGLAYRANDLLIAMCIPIISADGSVFTAEDEETILGLLQEVFDKHYIIGQNFNYDSQYFAGTYGIRVQASFDTMHIQHLMYPGTPKDLNFLSSLYIQNHVYWKDEGKDYSVTRKNQEALWEYNIKDVLATLKVFEGHIENKAFPNKELRDFMYQLQDLVYHIELRGAKIDRALVRKLNNDITEKVSELSAWLTDIYNPEGKTSWFDSPQQTMFLFYTILGVPEQYTLGKDRHRTVNDTALQTIGQKFPEFKPITFRIIQYRSLSVLQRNTIRSLLWARRFYTTFNIAGTKTFRFSSSKSVFGEGGNFQNLTKGSEDNGNINLRKLIIPDRGFTIFEWDLAQADAQVVAADAGDTDLLDFFERGRKDKTLDLHSYNAEMVGCTRQQAKAGVHAINYGVKAAKLASVLKISKKRAQDFIDKWLKLHPAIAEWQQNTLVTLNTSGKLINAYGFHIVFFGRTPQLLSEALSWIPQSTVAIHVSKAMLRLHKKYYPGIQILSHGHDSIIAQVKTDLLSDEFYRDIYALLHVPIPYKRPLNISWGMECSRNSWGACYPMGWPGVA